MLKKQNVGGDYGLIKLNFKLKKRTLMQGWAGDRLLLCSSVTRTWFSSIPATNSFHNPRPIHSHPVNPFTFKG